MKKVVFIAALLLLTTWPAGAARIKDIGEIQGVRGNQLVGIGIVVGLAGTGDSQQVPAASQALSAMLNRFGLTVTQTNLKFRNVAAVMVTADLPAFAKPGSTIDVTVSSLGDSTTLQGGVLVQTPLLAANGQTYAVAQGSVSVGGFVAGGQGGGGGGGAQGAQNHVTVARIPAGAYVERAVATTLTGADNTVSITLHQADFTTAVRVADAINGNVPVGVVSAKAMDAATISVRVMPNSDLMPILAALENIEVDPDESARVIINERTGTVVLGGAVTVSSCAIAQGDLTVRITEAPTAAQPAANVVSTSTPTTKPAAADTTLPTRLMSVPECPTIDRVVKALNTLGVKPRDLISILQSLKQAGALHAELEIQ